MAFEDIAPAHYQESNYYFPTLSLSEKSPRKLVNSHVTPLFLAVSYNQFHLIDGLLAKGANPNEALWVAAVLGNTELIKKLIKAGGDVTQLNYDQHSPIFYAAYYGHAQSLELLLKNKKGMQECDQCSPIFAVAQNGHVEAIHCLIKYGASVYQTNELGWQPLHMACFHGQAEVVNALLAMKVRTNHFTLKGETALYLALKSGKHEIIEKLIADKEDLFHTLVYAIKQKDIPALKILESYCKEELFNMLRQKYKPAYSVHFFKEAKENLTEALSLLLSEKEQYPELQSRSLDS